MPSDLSKRLSQLTVGDWLGQAIDTSKAFYSPEKWVEPNSEIHPSGSGGPCAREIELGMLGHRTEVGRKNKRRMDNGTDAHTRWTKELESIGVLDSAGVRIKIPGEWSGEYDLICRNPITQKRHLGEIKTMNEIRFKRIPAQEKDLELMAKLLYKVEKPYVHQLTQYWVMLKKQGIDISDEAFFLFENTNDQSYSIRWLKLDESMKEEAFANSSKAREAMIKGELLDPPFPRRSITCSKCYRELLCYRIQDSEPVVMVEVENALLKSKSGNLVNIAEHEGRESLKDNNFSMPDSLSEEEGLDELIEW